MSGLANVTGGQRRRQELGAWVVFKVIEETENLQ